MLHCVVRYQLEVVACVCSGDDTGDSCTDLPVSLCGVWLGTGRMLPATLVKLLLSLLAYVVCQ